MVKEGQAIVYRQYLNGCSATKEQYLQAETQARQKRLGFWNQKLPVMPWDYRRGKRSVNPQTSNKVAPSVQKQAPPSCINSDCNCSDFKTQAQAQQVLTAFPGDKFRLDGDSDGVACESLP
jgi:micrococcal nuclease